MRQHRSDLEEFQVQEACQFTDKPAPAQTTPGSSVAIPAGTKGPAQIATQLDSSVKHTVPPTTGGVPPAVKPPWKARPQVPPGEIGATSSTTVEPVSTRPDVRRDMIRQLEDVKDPPYIRDSGCRGLCEGTSCQGRLRHLSDGIPDVVGRSENGYNNLENDRILRLATGPGLSSETDKGELGARATVKEIVNVLYVEDYDNFVNITIGARDPVIGVTRLDAYRKARTVSPAPVALRVTLFAITANPWSLSREELEWITYLFNEKYTMQNVEG
jgi:hypothetical protein